ncbi:SusD family protein [Flavobacterium fluvii]|uniref:SusD family protein n=1 Tax=Flavobacterium fluvii TaxID=468056 RepID=A0A1M5K295_9FLAO|nr:RagB/SusD family nutrient uptake outer membrane protein [Flavobacterium fluvii]SHG46874.1 SusD family protein [Flavobacterium fluvii]
MITTINTKTTKRILSIVSVMVLLFSLGSCSDYLDVEPEDRLSGDQVYRNVYDADAAVIGIYGKFMGLAEQHVILNEMRADLMTITRNSNPYLKELSQHNVSVDNPYANPKLFYEVIQNCNDVLKNFDIMLAEKKFTQSQYDQRYADVGCIRSWVYLQLGIHFGSVPYITEPIATLEDVKNMSKYPRIPFTELVDKLVTFTEGLNYKEIYDAQSSMLITVDGYYTKKLFINKECLIGDLQLWKGNYLAAASHYKKVLESASLSANDTEKYESYRLSLFAGSGNVDFLVRYALGSDVGSLYNTDTQGWRSIFARSRDVVWNTEWIWSLPFDSKFAPANPFIDLFSKNSGKYLAKPSQSSIDLWNSQMQRNGIPYDARGTKFTYNMVGGDPVIMKYLYKYQAVSAADPFKKDGDWFLYRAEKLHLRYAEAANRDNHQKIAFGILNFGIGSAYNPLALDGSKDDVTNAMRTFEAFPYDFDARSGDYPRYRDNWYRGGGIRGRGNLVVAGAIGDNVITTEDNIIREAALDLAYEGSRWEDLVRVALRRNDPSFLADKVYEKLSKEGNSNAGAVRSKLLNVNNWYLPFDWK